MTDPRSPGGDPLADITRVVTRTLWILFAGFAFAVVTYLALFVLTSGVTGGLSLGSPDAPPAGWGTVRYAFLAAGIVSLYASFRLRAWLLDPARLARRVAERRASAQAGRGPISPPVERAGAQTQDGDPAGAAQELVGRIILGHVLVWGLLEVPALLGVVGRIIGGETSVFVALLTMSAIGLALQRPASARVEEILRAHFSR